MKKFLWGFWGLLILVTLVVGGCGKSESVDDDFVTANDAGVDSTPRASVNDIDLQIGLSPTATYSMGADGVATVAVRAKVTNEAGIGMSNVKVSFSTTKGTLTGGGTSATANTDANGFAAVILTSLSTGKATVLVDVAGMAKEGTVTFVAGPPDAANSSITSQPPILLGDGSQIRIVSVTLNDANNFPLSEGTGLTLIADTGQVMRKSLYDILHDGNVATNKDKLSDSFADNYNIITSGRAEFVMTSPPTGNVILSLVEYPEIKNRMLMGEIVARNPANIMITPDSNHIAVNETGQVSQTNILLKVLDDVGLGINELTYNNRTLNNLRVRFATRPNGGEYLAGRDAANNIVDTRATGYIDIRTQNGEASLSLQAGKVPGNVEIRAEVLVDRDGNPLTTTVVANSPRVVISSGPPHTIVLTTPITNSIEDLGAGVYRRIGSALVTDRWGNTVDDGTSIYLGLYDSIIANGNATSLTGSTVTSAAGNFLLRTITRNDALRGVQPNDHIIFTNLVEAQDKHRTISAITNATTLTVSDNFTKSYPLTGQTLPQYIVGASLSGGSISGTDPANGNRLTTGASYTKDGIAKIFVTYPANSEHIMLGCNPSVDTRTLPMGSSVVGVIAKSTASPTLSNDRATTVSPSGLFCFAPVANFTVEASKPQISFSDNIHLTVRDGGDTIPVPFYPVTWTFVPPTGASFTDINAVPQNLPLVTDINGQVDVTVVVSGTGLTPLYEKGVVNYGVLTFYSEKGKMEVKVYHP